MDFSASLVHQNIIVTSVSAAAALASILDDDDDDDDGDECLYDVRPVIVVKTGLPAVRVMY